MRRAGSRKANAAGSYRLQEAVPWRTSCEDRTRRGGFFDTVHTEDIGNTLYRRHGVQFFKKIMKKRFFLVVSLFGLFVPSLHAQTVFSSRYTNLKKECKYPQAKAEESDGDAPLLCPDFQDYAVSINWSATSGCLCITRIGPPKDQYETALPSIACDRGTAIAERTLEWRLADGTPFAVIIRHSEWDERDVNPKKIGESLVVKGLTGFESISESIDTAKEPRANEIAREQADAGYKKIKLQSH